MKKLVAVLLLFLPIMGFSSSDFSIISQKRLPNESYQEAIKRFKKSLKPKALTSSNDDPLSQKVAVFKLDSSKATEVKSYQELLSLFQLIRDKRFLTTRDKPDFLRRISWLYPDDGCFARAATAGIKLAKEHKTRPTKIYVFGDLAVQTPYAQNGQVSWWYHVALVARYKNELYVLDPALNPKGPLLAEDWFRMMSPTLDTMEASICNQYSYSPGDRCMGAEEKSDKLAPEHQLMYLQFEWERMEDLGYDPVVVLGDNPPWL